MENYLKIVLAEYSDTFNRNKKMENAKMNLKLLVLNKVKVLVTQSYLTLCDPMDCVYPTRFLCPWDFPGKNTGVVCRFLLHSKGLVKVKVKSLSHVRLFATPWTVVHQAPPPMGFSRQEYWSG